MPRLGELQLNFMLRDFSNTSENHRREGRLRAESTMADRFADREQCEAQRHDFRRPQIVAEDFEGAGAGGGLIDINNFFQDTIAFQINHNS